MEKTEGTRMSKRESHWKLRHSCITSAAADVYVVHKSRLIKIIWRLTNSKELQAAQVVGCTSHARACRYINERDKKGKQKNLAAVKAKSLEARIIDTRS